MYGIGFVVYAFAIGAVTNTTFTTEQAVTAKETLVESGGGLGVVLGFTPIVLGLFVAVLLRLARKDHDNVPLAMAWIFSAFTLIVSIVSLHAIGRFLLAPALLMLLATGLTQWVVSVPREQAT